jgi:hypothetical protein
MATTTTTSIAPAIPTEVLDPLVLASLRDATLVTRLIRNVDISGIPGLKYDFNSFTALSAASKTQGTDFTPSAQLIAEDGTVTAAEIGVAIDLADIAVEASQVSPLEFAREIGSAVAEKMEKDGCAAFASASASVGTSGAAFTMAQFEEAVTKMRIAKAPSTVQPNFNLPASLAGYYSVLSERQVADLALSIRQAGLAVGQAPTQIADLIGSVAANAVRFVYFGVPVYGTTANTTANAGADAVGAVLCPAALGLVVKRAPRLESQRHALGTSEFHVASAVYGVGLIKQAFIQKVVTRATA